MAAIRSLIKPGDQLGPYKIVRKLGAGGMGIVWEAWEEELRRKVAIKVLSSEALSNPALIERFRGEGRALAMLKHPNVVLLYTLGFHDNAAFMALEYIEGKPLDHFLMSHPCGLQDILHLIEQMAEGLAAAHEAGVIHRDLKPANVIVDTRLNAKLIDFGIAKVYSEHQSYDTSAELVIGTANYLSPEVAAGRAATAQSDIYSLGLVLYYMLTGETPFIGRSNLETIEKIRTSSIAFSPRLQILLPERLKQMVAKMTAKIPSLRYASVREMLTDLRLINLETLPSDLRDSPDVRLPLANYSEVRKKCEAQGFDSAEMRFIINLSARIQLGNRAVIPDDATIKTERARLLKIQESSLQQAITRFQAARATVAGRRATESVAIELKTIPRRRIRGRSWPAALVVVLLVIALVVMVLSQSKPAREPASVITPADEP